MSVLEIVGVVAAVLVLILLLTPRSKLESSGAKKSSKTALKVSDYLPKEQNADGVWCSRDMALEIIDRFSSDLGIHKKASEFYKNEFVNLIESAKKHYENELSENDDNYKSHIDHYSKQIEDVKNSGEDSSYISDETNDIEQEIKQIEKSHKKVDKWLNKHLSNTETDVRKYLKLVLTQAQKAWRSDSKNYHHIELYFDYPELPDSYYY